MNKDKFSNYTVFGVVVILATIVFNMLVITNVIDLPLARTQQPIVKPIPVLCEMTAFIMGSNHAGVFILKATDIPIDSFNFNGETRCFYVTTPEAEIITMCGGDVVLKTVCEKKEGGIYKLKLGRISGK